MNKLILVALLLLSACASSGPSSPAVRQPMAQQVAVGEARTRAKTRTELGMRYFLEKQYGTALDEARKSISADSGYAPAYSLLGMIYMELGQASTAQESFERALRLAPGDPDISNNYGWFLCQSGQAAKSIEYFRVAINDPLYKAPGLTMVNAGVCLVRSGDDRSAENSFRSALQLDPENPRALFEMASMYVRTGRLTEARQRISQLHGITEPTSESAWLAAKIARMQGNKQDEAAFSSLLRRRFPGSPETQKLQLGQFE